MRSLPYLLALAFAVPSLSAEDTPAIAPDGVSYAKDHPGAVYPELKIYDAQQQPLRMPKEDWAGAAARVSGDPEWAGWVQGRRKEVDEWIQKRHDKVEWIAGWYHDFVSPKDGSMLAFTPDEPGPETLHSKSDPKVALTPKLHAAWVFNFRSNYAKRLLESARLYRLTGDKKYAEWTASSLDFYAANLLKWPLDSPEHAAHMGESRLMGQALDEASILISYVQAARTLKDYATPERSQRWSEQLFKPEARLLQKSRQVIHNIGCWQRAAVGEVALYCKDQDLWRQAVDSTNGIHDQLARGVTSDYLWCEQSLHYNNFVVDALGPFFIDAMMAGRGAELKEDMETAENLMLTPAAMRFPTGQLPNPTDGGKAERAPAPALWSRMAPLFPTKVGVYELAHDKSWAALLDPPDPAVVPAQPPELPPVVSRSYESSRMAVVRQGSWQVYLHYGQITGSHVQSEALNFEAFYGNTNVTQDAGSVGYGSPMFNEYYRAGVCHNVPLVDGLGQEGWTRGQLDGFADDRVSASQPKYRSNATASRSMSIDGNSLQDTARVATSDGKTHTLGFLLHLMGKAEGLPASFVVEPDPTKIQPGVTGFKYWKDAARATFRDRASFTVRIEKELMRVDFELPGEFTVWHASAPDLLPRRRDVFYLEVRGTDATMKTTIRPAAPGE